MSSLLNSLKIEEKVNENKPHSSSFVFYHLPAGMGITVGNFLRRSLSDYISGIAPLGVKISDKNGSAESEFSVLSGVVDTVPYLIPNLKKVVIEEKKKKEGIFCLELNVENKEKKERIITADDFDFQKDKDIEIKNPKDFYLTTLAAASSDRENAKLEIKLYCQRNWGYHRAEEEEEQKEVKKMIKKYFPDDEDIIVLDVNYSPVKQVSFEKKEAIITPTKVEEELTITITTNGAVSPKKALQEALEIAESSFKKIAEEVNKKKETKTPTSKEKLETKEATGLE